MEEMLKPSLSDRIKTAVLGGPRSPRDHGVMHKISLAAFLAWVGLGSDGLSSSCYGPPEAFIELGSHHQLGIYVALATAITIFVVSASYSQIIELFPSGGGGYLVASKLLSPKVGVVSGCALLVDYVLTVTTSIASGTDALLSMGFVPEFLAHWKVSIAIGFVLVLTLLNVRGVRESVAPLVPIFVIFVLVHVFLILYAVVTRVGAPAAPVLAEAHAAASSPASALTTWGMILLVIHSYSMGAGTFTGIEAVSNGMPILREPKVRTAKRTMFFMALSLSFVAAGLMIAYLLFAIVPQENKTLNAVLLEKATSGWHPGLGQGFVIVALISEAAILIIAAQTGFLDAPRILSYMAMDRWMPNRLSLLSDRLVTQNGVLLMSAAVIVTMLLSRGDVSILLVLYSINVFITFCLSQLGMVRHWWISRKTERRWLHGLAINGTGLFLTTLILVWIIIIKFLDGGWVTLVVTSSLVSLAFLIRKHYDALSKITSRVDALARSMLELSVSGKQAPAAAAEKPCDPQAKTAVVMVSGYHGLGLHLVQNVVMYFGDVFRNFVFVCVGVVDAGNFKGATEVENLEKHVQAQADRYVELMRREGYYAKSVCTVGNDLADIIATLAPQILAELPQSVFFAQQLIFPKETFLNRLLHNNIVFSIQKRLYRQGVPFVILPFRVG
jgi:amino acid transporter